MLYTYYGDDFTGSTDVLEQLGANGIPAVLFTAAPTPAQLAAFPNVQAIGIAGDARSRSPEWMSANLPTLFRTLQQFRAPITHYKTCSTFDSSPTTGSIGRVLEIGLYVFSSGAPNLSFLPIVVGAPHLRRYVAFGNLFASAPDGSIQRIDRHPMASHPVTPMREADLRRHLAAQTSLPIGLIDHPTLNAHLPHSARSDEWEEQYLNPLIKTHPTILFDTIDNATLSTIGELLWTRASHHPLFAAGSSGLTAALVSVWNRLGLTTPQPLAPLPSAGPLLILSGSCSPVTERQIRYALAHGYRGFCVDPINLLNPSGPAYIATLEAASKSLTNGHDTVLYTALGAPTSPAHGDLLGIALGNLLCELLARSSGTIRRVLLCGGDTSSHAVQQLGIHALTWAANIQSGAPLCRAHVEARRKPYPPLELVLKGGQVGTADFFDHVRGS